MKKTISVFLWSISLLCFCFFLFPLANAGIIHITQTTGPVILGTANTTYILDNNITSTGHGVIIGKSNIVLDLNGHTVTFGTDTTLHNRCGVVIPTTYQRSDMPDIPDSCFKGADTIVIKNGSIIHGADGQDCKIVYSYEGVRKVEISHIKGKIRGIDGEGFVFLYDYDINIHDDSVETALTKITNRQDAKGVIHVHLSGGSLKVQNNTIWGYGHFGYWMSSKKAYPTTELICSGNKSSVHGITTNSIQLWFSGFSKAQQNTNIQIYNNRVTCPGSVSNRGLYLEGVDGSTDGVDGAKIYGNYIECKEHGNLEYGDAGWTHCIRIRDAGNGVKKNFNNEFYNDTLIANGYWVNADTNGGGWCIRLSNSAPLSPSEQNLFHDNVITANSADTHTACETYCIGFEEHTHPSCVFYNNTITSNSKMFEWYHAGGDSVTFRSNNLNLGANPINFKTMKFENFSEGSDPLDAALGNIFLDNTLGSGVSYKNIYLSGYEASPRSFYSQWYLDINVKDSLGQNVSNAIVKGYDKSNVLRYTDTTDASGNAQLILSEFYFYSSGGTDTSFTYYNPYRITASKGGVTSQVEVTMNASKNINVRISGENHCPSVPTLNLPADEDTVLGTRPMLSLNNSVDTDGDILVYDFQVCSDSQMTSLVASGT
ncbi:MAG: hypothetical protein MUO85_00890, partial [candidate division Zixibacteria bacterium]|nr:hypothetical protein [candidate division Zixibacteria bacterium]